MQTTLTNIGWYMKPMHLYPGNYFTSSNKLFFALLEDDGLFFCTARSHRTRGEISTGSFSGALWRPPRQAALMRS